MAGTFVLTDTMTRAFNDLVNRYAPIDVLVRSSNAFTAQTSSLEERDPMPESVLQDVEAVPASREPAGTSSATRRSSIRGPGRRSAPSAADRGLGLVRGTASG